MCSNEKLKTSDWIFKKLYAFYMYVSKYNNDMEKFKVKGWKTIYHANTNQKTLVCLTNTRQIKLYGKTHY